MTALSHVSLAGRSTLGKAWAIAKPYWSSEDRWIARGLLASVIGLALFMVYMDVLFNSWYKDFYNALEKKNEEDFWTLILWFSFLAAVYIMVAGYNRYLNLLLQLRWRRWLTDQYLEGWLKDRVHYRLELKSAGTDNVDQRIQEDLKDFAGLTLSLGLDFMSSVVTFVTFANILWTLSGPITLPIGDGFVIHGYMMWVAVVYAVVGSWLTQKVGAALTGLNFNQQRYEADFRFGLIRVRENAESIAAYAGEPDEKRNLMRRFQDVWQNFLRLMIYSKRLTWFQFGYQQLAIIFPIVVVAPRYFLGKIEFGVIFQTSSAFGQVQRALSWFVTAYGEIAQWRATLNRLTTFHDALEDARQQTRSGEGIQRMRAPDGALALRDATLRLPTGDTLLGRTGVTLKPGEHTLITGPSGIGKSTLFRALSGIWPFGEGTVEVPEGARLMFLPQQPYLPIGPLRDAVAYPAFSEAFGDDVLQEALRACQLPALAPRLDESDHWAHRLSIGEQQRLAFARALLNKPDWLFLDEATSALDEATEQKLYSLLRERLPNTTLVSIAHRASLARHHDRRLEIVPEASGARLVEGAL
ncbi:MAG: ABC transporter ATP-binding protein/permease [Gammaproteobacteria bacterium]|nr:ABC transporter ATP-binding protein/permease [Gammaproteobacteria bacterium]